MQRSERLKKILSAVVAHGRLDVSALATEFAVSEATIRRDLDLLEQQRLVSRTRGGVTTHAAFNDLPLAFKSTDHLPEKQQIGACALGLLEGARVIGLTGGTTITEFVRELVRCDNITVVTNALNVATDLLANPRLRVFTAGGEVRASSSETVGPSAESFIAGYNLDVAFVGVDGVDARAGCTNYDPMGARVNHVLLQRAKRRIVLADASKIGTVALARLCAVNEIDMLVTDDRVLPSQVDALTAAGCRVVVAGADGAPDMAVPSTPTASGAH